MTDADKNRFKEIMLMLVEMYRQEISPALTRIYWEALKCMTITELERAVQAHIVDTDQGMYMPKPAHLLAIVYGSDKTRSDEAAEAWQALCSARATGDYDIGPKTKAAIASIGGTYALRMMTNDELARFKFEFMANYKSNLKNEAPKMLTSNQALVGKDN